MTISELIIEIEELCLSHKSVIAFQKGNSFDVATSKSSEAYPAVWFELPLITNYVDARKKTHGTALNFLTLAKSDDINDQLYHTSEMEVIADEVMQALKEKFPTIGLNNTVGLTLRNFSDDDLVGVRIDLTFTVGRECDYKNSFNREF